MIIPSLACLHQRGRYVAAMLLACLFFAGGCGQTGALYLPESQVQTTSATPTEAEASDKVEEEARERRPTGAADPGVDVSP